MLFATGYLYVAVTRWGMPIGSVLVLIFLFVQVIRAMNKIQRKYQLMVSDGSALWSIREMIDQAHAQAEPRGGAALPSLDRGIALERVTVDYGGPRVLEDLTLEIPAGQISAIIGGSGAGKTTLIDLLTGLIQPQSGCVRIDGSAASGARPHALAPHDRLRAAGDPGPARQRAHERDARRSGSLRRGRRARLAGGGRPRVRLQIARGARHQHGRARHALLRRATSAHRHRARSRAPAEAPDPRRGHRGARPGHRGRCLGGGGAAARQDDRGRDLASAGAGGGGGSHVSDRGSAGGAGLAAFPAARRRTWPGPESVSMATASHLARPAPTRRGLHASSPR